MILSASSPPKRVALLIETTRTYTRDILAGIRQYVARHGPWSTFIEIGDFEREPPAWLHRWDGDGILTRTFTPEMARVIRESGLPAIELRSPKLCPGLPFCGMNNQRLGTLVAKHFLNRGYRKFAAYTLDIEPFFRERISNYRRTLAGEGHACDALPAEEDGHPGDWEKNQERLVNWLLGLPKPVGIFAANDQLGVRLLDACQRAGLHVPEEIAVVGAENEVTLCEFASPTLTSVAFNGREVGYQAAEALDRLMSGQSLKEREMLIESPGIVTRESSDDLVIEDLLIRDAVKLIRERALDGTNVNDVCRILHVSRSTLERRMKQALGRPPKAELLRIRFKEVERLLQETDLTIEAISDQTGFAHCHYMQNHFKRRYGLTPGEFRKNRK
ncbi:MAG: DNA-binding transcriptional regulator [Verrucomicrobiae bacterium]|nr:DNA-binding transcriptional regulator [Verrucomicrobiae bacterium]